MIKNKKQRNNHARSKKNKSKMLAKKKHLKLMEDHSSFGNNSSGSGSGSGFIANLMKKLFKPKVEKPSEIGSPKRYKYSLRGTLNQRQKRKLWRQAPYMRKKAA